MNRTRFVLCLAAAWIFAPAVARCQGFSPEEALKRMKVADGFQVKLVASEPMIRQPVTMTFDDRGRMWVIQYIQYPTPAGLKPVEVDQYLRTKYDKVPLPPPKGPRGADKITILSDPDENGRFGKSRDFVTGLNLASGMAIGHGGVFVLQVPYLLFYPDRNGDDVPDGPPEVLLSGFGMEDAHAVANSLQWGPDGWLYGNQGSTVTAKIRGIEFQQGIWRYHPITKQFELFSEGGGNTWGLDFDEHGNAIAGTNWGGFAMLHQVQGGYYVKGFQKHGPLHNPHTYGYFDHVPYKDFHGGHVTIGGIVYQGGAFPESFNGKYIAGNVLSNVIHWHALERKGSSFTARFGGELLVANDTWFRPVDCLTGPDGAVYIADWYDKRANHVDPVDTWDRTNGRIYKIEAKTADRSDRIHAVAANLPLAKRSSQELVSLLGHPNEWYSSEARRILAERRDQSIISDLKKMVLENTGRLALESLWALYVSGGFNDALAGKLLDHPNEDVRTWTIRLLGDGHKVSPDIQKQLVRVARTDASLTVRSQLACTSKRLPARDGLPIVRELLQRKEDLDDPYIPLLLWWAIEDKVISDRELVFGLLDSSSAWRTPLVQKHIVARLARRYMAEGKDLDLAACARLLEKAPGRPEMDLVIRGLEQALEGRRLAAVPAVLEKPLAELWQKEPSNVLLVRLALRLGSKEAHERAVLMAGDAKVSEADRIGLIEMLSQVGRAGEMVPLLLRWLDEARTDSLRGALLAALQGFSDQRITKTVLAMYPKLASGLRGRAQGLLCSRPTSALEFLKAVDTGHINPKEVPVDQLQRVAVFKDERLTKLIDKHWGKIGPAAAGERAARIRAVTHLVNTRKGDPAKGKLLFTKHCANCHTLHGEGAKIGPDLNSVDRKNLSFLVTSIIDPSAVIRPEYVAQTVTTTDGRTMNGLVVESTAGTITLADSKAERTVLARSKIDEITPSPVSVMPEKLLDTLDEPDIRDLFAYLQSDPPASSSPSPPLGERHGVRGKAPLKVCLVSGSLEYKSDESLTEFQKYLESHYNVKCSRAFRKTDTDIPGLENLETCDVMLLFTRRLKIEGEQLERIKKYCKSGKPIVGVRTASHAFQTWLALDKEVLGGDYQGHLAQGLKADVHMSEKVKNHPILAGVKPFTTSGGLYKNPNLAKDVEVLLTAEVPDYSEPVAWTRTHNGGRVFYTSLGTPDDFKNENFRRMLMNAIFWTVKQDKAVAK